MKSVQFIFDTKVKEWEGLPSVEEWDSKETLAIVFCCPCLFDAKDNPNNPIMQLKSKFPSVQLIGCSTSGEIVSDELKDQTVSFIFMKFEKSNFKIFKSPIKNAESSYIAGVELAQNFQKDNLKGLLILSEGLQTNGTQLVKGINSLIGSDVIVGGGLAGDGTAFERTFVVYDNEVLSNHIVAVGFYGADLNISSVARGGWDIFGPQREITKSNDNVVYQIDGKPALDLYKNYLGDKAADLPASGLLFPLEISPPDQPQVKLVRTILSVDEKENSLVFAGDVPEGWIAQLMRANLDHVIDASQEAYKEIINTEASRDEEVVIAVSCVGRRLILGERCEDELEAIRDEMSKSGILTGFYSYGELAPNLKGSSCDLHNQTMTLFSIKEAA